MVATTAVLIIMGFDLSFEAASSCYEWDGEYWEFCMQFNK